MTEIFITSIQVMPSGYGHWKIYLQDDEGNKYSCTTNSSAMVDDYNSDEDDRRERGRNWLINWVLSRTLTIDSFTFKYVEK